MNIWTIKSIELASQQNYLDLLYKVYPMSVNLRREIDQTTKNKIRIFLENKDKKNLLLTLLEQEVFPIKDSYIAYLKKDKSAIDRNPNTVDRIFGILVDMGFDEIIDKATAPKETNRQIGPLFKRWINTGALGAEVTNDFERFLKRDGNIIFNSSDDAMKKYAGQYLGYDHEKGLDFIAKFNHTYILAETKFLTDFGGHQNAQFNDAISTMKSALKKTDKNVKIISILDGVLYIKGNHKMMKELRSFDDNEIVISSVLLRDYLYHL
ncbi:Tsp45I type II restriction enzyme [Mesocricetibacter intestinalis]|uniref:Tsp45I type II restriction enzyme n=1 Tax=Mesocricetibacter intestinalis TaxID=1521930 RepID=A0A4R6VE51_9PAST|nr:restriction endonuclease [Mesocricetibacter intestinalis]TDQ59024.1 Tsp45I type II restriction enzyme [Mesocricetibacter intestinalis]